MPLYEMMFCNKGCQCSAVYFILSLMFAAYTIAVELFLMFVKQLRRSSCSYFDSQSWYFNSLILKKQLLMIKSVGFLCIVTLILCWEHSAVSLVNVIRVEC